jgi:outer membrane autotransporter protein
MKKILIATAVALAATAASALEVGITQTRDYSTTAEVSCGFIIGPSTCPKQDRNGTGITVGEKFGKVGLTAGFERFTAGGNDQDRLSLVAGYDVAKVGPFTVTPKVGVAHLNNQRGADGYAMTAGVGATFPVTKKLNLGLDVARQYGQDRVAAFDGDRVTVGLRYKF